MRCAVFGCHSDNQSKRNPCVNIKFFRFPKNPNLTKKWAHFTKRNDKINIKNAVICSKHFCESDYKVNLKHTLLNYTPKNYRGLKDDAIPTHNVYKSQVTSVSLSSTSGAGNKRKLAYKNRQRAQLVTEILMTKYMNEEIPEPEIINNDGYENSTLQNLDNNVVVESCTTSDRE